MIKQKRKETSIHPLRSYVKVRILLPKEAKTKSGIIIPPTEREKVFRGIHTYEAEILEFSPEIDPKHIEAAGLKVGDIVLTDRLGGFGIPTDGDKYIKLVDYNMLITKKLNGHQTAKPDQMQALYERVLVEVEELGELKTDAGIILPEQNSSSIYDGMILTGKVLSAAVEVKGVKPGDRVCFEKEMGVPLAFPGVEDKEHKVLVKYDLLCKLD